MKQRYPQPAQYLPALLGAVLLAAGFLLSTTILAGLAAVCFAVQSILLHVTLKKAKQMPPSPAAESGVPARHMPESEILSSMIASVETLSRRISTNEEQMRLERQESEQIALELESLTESVYEVSATEDVNRVVDLLFQKLCSHYQAAGIELWLLDGWKDALSAGQPILQSVTPEGQNVSLVAAFGWEESESSEDFVRGAPVLKVVDSCSRLTANEPHSLQWLFRQSWVVDRGIRAFGSYPLLVRGECIGCLAVWTSQSLSDIFLGMIQCHSQLLALALADNFSKNRMRRSAQRLEAAHRRQQAINSQLAQADRLKSQFLANVSHELRTPLNGILGYLALLKDDLAQNEEERQEFLASACESAERLMKQITNLLSLSEIESGQAQLDLQVFDLNQAVRSLCEEVRPACQQKGLGLYLPDVEEMTILGDQPRIRHAVYNILDNAIKFTQAGSIRVSITNIRNSYHICVEDTGVGVDPDAFDAVFAKFTQIDGSSRRQFGGSGMGLAITSGLVKLMGGDVTFESAGADRGSLVSIALPAAPPDLLSGVWAPERQAPSVLLVQQDLSASGYLETLLVATGYTVSTVHSISDLITSLEQSQPDAICLAWSQGMEADCAPLVQKLLSMRQSPAVLVVTRAKDKARSFFADEGLKIKTAVTGKPLDPTEALDALRALLSEDEEPRRKAA